MSVKRKGLRRLRNVVLILIAAAVLLPWWQVVVDHVSGASYREYLSRNMQTIDLDETGGGLNFDADFYEHQLFMVGEIHGTQTAQWVDLRFMQHLNQRIGLRHVMAELDPTQADRLNAYLASGDEGPVLPMFRSWLEKTAQWGNQQHLDKFRALYRYNQTLPADRRFVFFGVDRIQDRADALDWFTQRLRDATPDSADAAGELLTALAAGEGDADVLRPLFDAALPGLFAGDRPMLAYMAENIRADLDSPARYERVEANVRTMAERFGIGDAEPVYGFWGLFHSLGATVNDGARPLVLRIRESDLPFADRVVNLTMSYSDSRQNMASRMLPEWLRPDRPYFDGPISQDNPYLSYLDGIGDLKAVAGDAEATVFRVNGPDSPYANGGRMVDQSGLLTYVFRFEIDEFEGFLTDYVILVQGAPALTPFEG